MWKSTAIVIYYYEQYNIIVIVIWCVESIKVRVIVNTEIFGRILLWTILFYPGDNSRVLSKIGAVRRACYEERDRGPPPIIYKCNIRIVYVRPGGGALIFRRISGHRCVKPLGVSSRLLAEERKRRLTSSPHIY